MSCEHVRQIDRSIGQSVDRFEPATGFPCPYPECPEFRGYDWVVAKSIAVTAPALIVSEQTVAATHSFYNERYRAKVWRDTTANTVGRAWKRIA